MIRVITPTRIGVPFGDIFDTKSQSWNDAMLDWRVESSSNVLISKKRPSAPFNVQLTLRMMLLMSIRYLLIEETYYLYYIKIYTQELLKYGSQPPWVMKLFLGLIILALPTRLFLRYILGTISLTRLTLSTRKTSLWYCAEKKKGQNRWRRRWWI